MTSGSWAEESTKNECAGLRTFNVREFGAKGDGTHLDTAAIQAAIDACAKDSGGTVLVPTGAYLMGTLFLKDNVTLHLAPEAVLRGSTNLQDYSTETKSGFLYNTPKPLWDRCLIYGEKRRNIAITGTGTIDGQGRAFPRSKETPGGPVQLERPMLIRLVECHGVTFRDVTLKNSGCWGAHLEKSDRIRIEGVTIDNRVNATNDGIDLASCRDVHISNCNIASFDDAIALKDAAIDVVITNCIVRTYCAAFRLGPESTGKFENIAVTNCVVRDTYHCGIKMQIAEGGSLENVLFSNIAMDNVTGPISIRLSRWQEDWMPEDYKQKRKEIGVLRNVMIDNIRARVADTFVPIYQAEADREMQELEYGYLWAFRKYGPRLSCISITGLPGHAVEGLTLSNIHVTFPGGGTAEDGALRDVPDLPDAYPEYWMFGVLPAYGLYAHHVKGLVLNNVQFDLAAPDLRPAVVCRDVENLEMGAFRAQGSPEVESLLRLQQAREVFIHNSRPLTNVGTFLRLEGPESRDVLLSGNALRRAKAAVETAAGASSEAVMLSPPSVE